MNYVITGKFCVGVPLNIQSIYPMIMNYSLTLIFLFKENMMQRTVNLEGPILNDRTMLDLIIESNSNVASSQIALEETNYLLEHLSDKRTPYMPVAEHGARLYDIIQKVLILDPFYHVSLRVYMKIFMQTVEDRQRGKGTQGK